MRQILTTLIILVVVATNAVAQPQQGEKNTRQRLVTLQLEQIVSTLKLEGDRLAKFTTLYNGYNEENRSLLAKRRGEKGKQREEAEDGKPTDEQIEADILRSFEFSKQSIELKARYYTLFREILSPSEIATMYDLERHTRERFSNEQQNRNQQRGAGGRGGSTPPPPAN